MAIEGRLCDWSWQFEIWIWVWSKNQRSTWNVEIVEIPHTNSRERITGMTRPAAWSMSCCQKVRWPQTHTGAQDRSQPPRHLARSCFASMMLQYNDVVKGLRSHRMASAGVLMLWPWKVALGFCEHYINCVFTSMLYSWANHGRWSFISRGQGCRSDIAAAELGQKRGPTALSPQMLLRLWGVYCDQACHP